MYDEVFQEINGATYVKPNTKKTSYASICSHCEVADICDEPYKERRISCPDETMKKWLTFLTERIAELGQN